VLLVLLALVPEVGVVFVFVVGVADVVKAVDESVPKAALTSAKVKGYSSRLALTVSNSWVNSACCAVN
jgi:hypothetical protein